MTFKLLIFLSYTNKVARQTNMPSKINCLRQKYWRIHTRVKFGQEVGNGRKSWILFSALDKDIQSSFVIT